MSVWILVLHEWHYAGRIYFVTDLLNKLRFRASEHQALLSNSRTILQLSYEGLCPVMSFVLAIVFVSAGA